jgi:hypothetical protein
MLLVVIFLVVIVLAIAIAIVKFGSRSQPVVDLNE